MKGKTQTRQYLLAVSLSCYKWDQNHTEWRASEDTEPRKGMDIGRCTSEALDSEGDGL